MSSNSFVAEPRAAPYLALADFANLRALSVDARTLALLDNVALRNQIRRLDKIELASVWRLTQAALARMAGKPLTSAPAPAPAAAAPSATTSTIDMHHRLLQGLPGEALLVSSSMFLASMAEAEAYFGLSFKTLKSRLGGSLTTTESERALRAVRAVLSAADLLGNFDAARAWLHSRNYALGGTTPAALLKTAEGERLVLDELQAQAEGAPL